MRGGSAKVGHRRVWCAVGLAFWALVCTLHADPYFYTISDGTVSIYDYIGTESEIDIPSSFEGYPVTRLGDWSFYQCSSLTRVLIPDSVTNIGEYAFGQCDHLTSIMLPPHITRIRNSSFFNCSSLAGITLPAGVTDIEQGAFLNDVSLKTILIPSAVTNIGSMAFQGCTNLVGVYCLGHAPVFGDQVFERATNVTVYYLSGKTGWSATAGGRPTVMVSTAPPVLGVTPASRTVPGAAGTTTFDVKNNGGSILTYTTDDPSDWIRVVSLGGGVNNGAITLAYEANPGPSARTGQVTVVATDASGSPQIVKIVQRSPTDTMTEGDYDNDGVTDLAVFDTAGGFWYIKAMDGRSLAWANQWGWNTAKPVPGDYDGDGKWDQAIFDTVGGYWYIKSLSGSGITWRNQWGWSTAKPVPGDYDGDGKHDLAVFDTQGGYWYIKTVAGAVITWANQWGWSTAIPVPGDYDGDGKSDLAIFDTSAGKWYVKSVDGRIITWGLHPDASGIQSTWHTTVPVPGDYDGDGKCDLAVYDTLSGVWFICDATGKNITTLFQWGFRGGRPIPGDYDGDQVWDLAVFDPAQGLWYIKSLQGPQLAWAWQWGWPGAAPVPAAIGAIYPNFIFGTDNSANFNLGTITVTDLKTGSARSFNQPRAAGLFPGNYKVVAHWWYRSGGSFIYRTASGDETRTFTARAGRDYQVVLSGGTIDGIWYTPPNVSITEK